MILSLRKSIVVWLLFTIWTQLVFAFYSPPSLYSQEHKNLPPIPESLTLTTDQFGIAGPFSGGMNYSSLTGAFFSGQYIKKFSEQTALGILGEYGDNQYRINGTLGFFLAEKSLLKITAEQLSQKLPFTFDTGSIDKRVYQNALGFRYQQYLESSPFDNLSLGGYLAKAPSVSLSPIYFISNGNNCTGSEAGQDCVNERNIAGSTSMGADIGLGAYLTRATYLEGKVYYDNLLYNTLFFNPSIDRYQSGLGGGLYTQHLISNHLKISASAEIRKIYDTYNMAFSWLPEISLPSEFSFYLQKVVSHNLTPDNDLLGLQITLFADRTSYQATEYRLNGAPVIEDIATWVKQPAVKMYQVLVMGEQYTHLIAPTISSISPNHGPLAGGTVVSLSGHHFGGHFTVYFGSQPATIVSSGANSISVIVPPSLVSGPVDVTLIFQNGRQVTVPNGYTYTNTVLLLSVLGLSPQFANSNGGTLITINGDNFIPGQTTIEIDAVSVSPLSVTNTEILFIAPLHAPGNVGVAVSTPEGTIYAPGGLTYISTPTASSLSPTGGPAAGGTLVTVSGSHFIPGNTAVLIGGITIPSGAVTVNSSTTLSFSTPPHTSGNVNVNLITPAGFSNNVPGGFTYESNAPTATALNPTGGPVSGGTVISLSGTGFIIGNTSVNIGGITIPANAVTVNTSTSLTFNTPAHAAGNVDVNVSTSIGTSGNVPGGFTYVLTPVATSLSPIAGSTAGGTLVTLSGSGFISGNTTVTLDGITIPAGSVTVNSSISLSFTTPAHAAENVNVSVTTPAGTSGNVPGGFTYEDSNSYILVASVRTSFWRYSGDFNGIWLCCWRYCGDNWWNNDSSWFSDG